MHESMFQHYILDSR